jgi:hypothetical protein
MQVTLLGPQRRVAGARTAVAELVPEGPVAAINAGWREREADTAELDAVLGGRMVNLELHRRWVALTDTDEAYAVAERRLLSQLEELRSAYQLRLRHAVAAVRAVSQRVGAGPVGNAARADAVAGVRALDAWHLRSSAELRHGFYAEVHLGARDSVEEQRAEVAAVLDGCAGLVVAGGHVGVLLHLLHLFAVAALLGNPPRATTSPNPPGQAGVPPVIAWSAGAMALSPRVVLFGDHAPSGHPDPEVYAEGLGAYTQCVPFPHARRRLRLGDPDHIGLLAERLAPYPALRLDDGVRLDLVDGSGLPGSAVVLGGAS